MRVHIVASVVCFFIASVLTIQLWINVTKMKAKDSPFAAEKCSYIYGHAVLSRPCYLLLLHIGPT